MATRQTESRLVHGDLGPEHIRVVGEQIDGVIDWGDTCVTDPALDLAWTALGSSAAFAEAVVAAYRPDEDLLARARDWHLLGPWHEVLYGLGAGRSANSSTAASPASSPAWNADHRRVGTCRLGAISALLCADSGARTTSFCAESG